MRDTLNRIVNTPEVHDAVAPGYPEIDLSRFCDNPRNVAYGDGDRGAVIFAWRGDGRYEVHYLLTNALRGREALRFIAACRDDLFTNHAATAIIGSTPRMNRAARAMNRALGGRPLGESTDTQGRRCIDYILERDTWATYLESAASHRQGQISTATS